MKVAVVGTGYVGLVTGACLSNMGHTVTCVDNNVEKVEKMKLGISPIYEPGLEDVMSCGMKQGLLHFTTNLVDAVQSSDIIFIAVGTPSLPSGETDTRYVEAVAREIGLALEGCKEYKVIINKSTVPIGSGDWVRKLVNNGNPGAKNFDVVSNPEFLREGTAVYDTFNPDRIVLGGSNSQAIELVKQLYSSLTEDKNVPVVVTDITSAEMIKYAANAFLATKISFINEMANICERVGGDVTEVAIGIGLDSRIGNKFLQAGIGWGGSCFHPSETILVRREGLIQLLTFEQLFRQVEEVGADGWKSLSWRESATTPEWLPITHFTSRYYEGEMVELRTKMGRRVNLTLDHPMIVGDGITHTSIVKQAGEITIQDWLPISLGLSLASERTAQSRTLKDSPIKKLFRRESKKGVLYSTRTNGTFIPEYIEHDADFWRMVGLYASEGSITTDGCRIGWHFHPTNENHLVNFIVSYWQAKGVKTTVTHPETSAVVKVSSRILSHWLTEVLGMGRNSYDMKIPDLIWSETVENKKALLRGLWDSDGCWMLCNGGSSVVLNYGTVSPVLADQILRLLGELGIVANVRIGRTTKSTVDAYWIYISGAEQIEQCSFLFPEGEQKDIQQSLNLQARRILPTGYRKLSSQNTAWVRVTSTNRSEYSGMVYSVEVGDTHTVVTTNGLVAHNCFPKDIHALVHTSYEYGYTPSLLEATMSVNKYQVLHLVEKLQVKLKVLKGKTVGLLGLTFKPNTDDMRDAPSLKLAAQLSKLGVEVRGYDPIIKPDSLPDVEVYVDIYSNPVEMAQDCDALVLVTNWAEFQWLDYTTLSSHMRGKVFIDGRNMFSGVDMVAAGFDYCGVGRY